MSRKAKREPREKEHYYLSGREFRRLHRRSYRAQETDAPIVCGALLVDDANWITLRFMKTRNPTDYWLFDEDFVPVREEAADNKLRLLGCFHDHAGHTDAGPQRFHPAGCFTMDVEMIYATLGHKVKLWRHVRDGKRRRVREIPLVVAETTPEAIIFVCELCKEVPWASALLEADLVKSGGRILPHDFLYSLTIELQERGPHDPDVGRILDKLEAAYGDGPDDGDMADLIHHFFVDSIDVTDEDFLPDESGLALVAALGADLGRGFAGSQHLRDTIERQLVDAFVALTLAEEGSKDHLDNLWADELLLSSWRIHRVPELHWQRILAVLDRVIEPDYRCDLQVLSDATLDREMDQTDTSILMRNLAYPLERLLWLEGPRFIERVEEYARHDPRFRVLLRGVRRGSSKLRRKMPDDVWARVQVAARLIIRCSSNRSAASSGSLA